MLSAKEKAKYAKDLLENPVLVLAFEKIREECFQEFCDTKADEGQKRELMWLRAEASAKLLETLEGLVNEFRLEFERQAQDEQQSGGTDG